MTDQTEKPENDSSEETVIGFKGAEQHHDLKNQPGAQGNADHAAAPRDASDQIEAAVDASDSDGPVADALEKAVK